MRNSTPNSSAPRRLAAACAVAATLGAGVPTAASAEPLLSVNVAPYGGAFALDSSLRDFRFDPSASPLYGVHAFATAGRFEPGVRVWRSSSRQDPGIPGDDTQLDVSLTVVEATVAVRLARIAGFRLLANGSAGTLSMSWTPAELEVDLGLAEPTVVEFSRVSETIWGAGVTVRRSVLAGFDVAVGADRTWFQLDTAHRRGDEIVTSRDTFGNWTARVELSRSLFVL